MDRARNGTREKYVSVLLQQWQTKTMLVYAPPKHLSCGNPCMLLKAEPRSGIHALRRVTLFLFGTQQPDQAHTTVIWLNEIVGSSLNNVFVCLKISAWHMCNFLRSPKYGITANPLATRGKWNDWDRSPFDRVMMSTPYDTTCVFGPCLTFKAGKICHIRLSASA